MKKTCMNCKYFHGCLSDEGANYHVHDYCEKLGQVIGNIYKSDLNRDLDFITQGTDYFAMCDDIETGDAYCYLFKETNPAYSDVYFDKNINLNKEIFRKCLDMKLEDPETTDEDRNYYLLLKEKYDL